MKKILICDKVSQNGLSLLREKGFQVDEKIGMPPEDLMKEIPEYEAVVIRSATKITASVLEAGKNLKLVVRGGVGLDNVDKEKAKELGITVRNTPDSSTESVAELVFALMLCTARKISDADSSMKSGNWEKKKFAGQELNGKVLGIIGTGRIGLSVAKKGINGFGMKVLGYDPYADQNKLKEKGVEPAELNDLLAQSDYLSFHLPLTDETRGMIQTEQFSKMKKGVILVNCSRGGIVSEKDLIQALNDEIITYAAVDVFEKEPLAEDSPLRKQERLILTPHIGASTGEGQARVSGEVAQVIIEELS